MAWDRTSFYYSNNLVLKKVCKWSPSSGHGMAWKLKQALWARASVLHNAPKILIQALKRGNESVSIWVGETVSRMVRTIKLTQNIQKALGKLSLPRFLPQGFIISEEVALRNMRQGRRLHFPWVSPILNFNFLTNSCQVILGKFFPLRFIGSKLKNYV